MNLLEYCFSKKVKKELRYPKEECEVGFGKKHGTGSVMEHNKAEHIRVLPEIILRYFLHI